MDVDRAPAPTILFVGAGVSQRAAIVAAVARGVGAEREAGRAVESNR